MLEYRASDLVKLDMLINGDPIDAFSVIIHRDKAYDWGRKIADKLKELIPRQLFEVAIQAAIGNKVIARTTVKALRKDVLAKCYGGDITPQAQAAREAEGRKEAHEAGGLGGDSAGSVSRGAAGRLMALAPRRASIARRPDLASSATPCSPHRSSRSSPSAVRWMSSRRRRRRRCCANHPDVREVDRRTTSAARDAGLRGFRRSASRLRAREVRRRVSRAGLGAERARSRSPRAFRARRLRDVGRPAVLHARACRIARICITPRGCCRSRARTAASRRRERAAAEALSRATPSARRWTRCSARTA